MARYIDTAEGAEDQSLGFWIEENLIDGDLTAFRAQTAWFSFGALEPFVGAIEAILGSGGVVHVVVGSNAGSLTKVDLERALNVVGGDGGPGLIVVRYGNATFHPKTFHVQRADGSSAAVVGSANLTGPGTEWNVEAAVVLDSTEGDSEEELLRISNAIDRWFGLEEPGVFRVASLDDVEQLAELRIIDVPQPRRTIESSETIGEGDGGDEGHRAPVGFRRRVWKPRHPRTTPATAPPTPGLAAVGPAPAPPAPATVTPLRWAKLLRSSDAQQVKEGTNPTGKLRLSKSGFDIDHVTFFRDQLFGEETWEAEVRTGGKTYEVAMVEFEVTFDGDQLGQHTLKIDYALHRIADQANVPTVLAWGHDLGSYLAADSKVGEWVTIERMDNGTFRLGIQPDRPGWA